MERLTASILNARLPYCFGEEIQYFQHLGSQLKPGAVVVVLGFGPGIMCMSLLEGANGTPIQLYAVDIQNFTGVEHLKSDGFEDKVYLIKDLSWNAASRFSAKSVDVLIVDACHDFDCVDRDIRAWWSKVKVGGTVFFHDYEVPAGGEPTGVKNAIEKNRKITWEEISRPGISIVYRRTQ